MVCSELLGGVDHGFGTRHAPQSQEGMASLKQIHSSRVLVAREAACLGDADALITNIPGLRVSIRTADCYPILISDSVSGAVAAVHAGWRGTAAQIVSETLRRMASEFGTNPKDVRAAIGPGIGICCYQVGREVASQLGVPGRDRVDLGALNQEQLLSAGVPGQHIELIGGCTFCDASRYHSFRRDKDQAGRMISYIGGQDRAVCPPTD